jgi:hypothetical protein
VNADNVEAEEIGSNDPNVAFNDGDIVADPRLWIAIGNLHPNIRDVARRAYIVKGQCQPKCHNYSRRMINGRNRSFQEDWFKDNPWLEYSVHKNATYYFYCYLFKQLRPGNYGVVDAFTVIGFRNWNDGHKLIGVHGDGTDHNKARKCYQNFKNQSPSVSHVMHSGGKKSEWEHKGHLIVVLRIIRFLLLQPLAFHGHDESASSTNQGIFKELLKWYKNKNKNVAYLLSGSQMTSPDIQKKICQACVEQTTKAIISDLGDRRFAILIDEAQDASIKEQMTFVLMCVL